MTKLNLNRDINGYNNFGRQPSQTKYTWNLTLLGGEKTITMPSENQKYLVIFSYEPGTSVWVAIGQTAVIPTSDPAVSNSELNPVAYELNAGEVIHLITEDTSSKGGIAIYAV